MLPYSTGQLATLACLLEISAPKPGNVHRGADFDDLTFEQMLGGAVAIGPAMNGAEAQPLGVTVLRAVQATRAATGTNTNLGTILLIAPLASVPRDHPLREGVIEVLAALDAADATATYEAIRLAAPGGMGRAPRHDLREAAPLSLVAAMREAAAYDRVAAQYAQGYDDFFRSVVPTLVGAMDQCATAREAIVHAHVQLMANSPDSLIARKRGTEVARESARRATQVLTAGGPGSEAYLRELAELDFWLRADGHARNPGTTADCIAAGLFACMRDGPIHVSQWLTPK